MMDREEREKEKEKKAKENRVKVVQQFRERENMAYDLDVEGAALTVRIFPTETATHQDDWRIEARLSDAAEAVVVTASAPTRAAALQIVASEWTTKVTSLGLPRLDWDAITRVLTAVRAV